MNKNKVLILSDKTAKFYSQLEFALSLKDRLEAFFLITFQNNVRLIDLKQAKKIYLKNPVSQKRKKKYLYNFFKLVFHNSFLGLIYFIPLIFFLKLKIKKLIHKEGFDLLILNGDRSGPSYETALLVYAKKYDLNVVIPYLSIIGSGKEVRLRNKRLYKVNFLNKYIYGKKSKHIFTYKNKKYGFYTISQYLALKYFGVLTQNPFSIGNNKITSVLCLDTHFTYHKVKNQISDHKKIKFVGRTEYDYLLKSDRKNKYLLLSLPQLFEHNLIEWETHIEFIKKTVKILTEHSKLVINLHPKCIRSDYEFLETNFNCIISNNQIKQDIVNASVFVCANSSIAIWSVLLGIKTIILNSYNLDMFILNGLNSLIYVNSESKLKKALYSNKQIDFSNDWKLLGRDFLVKNNCADRYVSLLNKLRS